VDPKDIAILTAIGTLFGGIGIAVITVLIHNIRFRQEHSVELSRVRRNLLDAIVAAFDITNQLIAQKRSTLQL
jgi:hypothetical protein